MSNGTSYRRRRHSFIPRYQRQSSFKKEHGLGASVGNSTFQFWRKACRWPSHANNSIVLSFWIFLVTIVLMLGTSAFRTPFGTQKTKANEKKFGYRFPSRVLILDKNISHVRQTFTVDGRPWQPTTKLPSGINALYKRAEKNKDSLKDKEYENNRMRLETEESGCPYIAADWQSQTSAKPTCNLIYEIDMHFAVIEKNGENGDGSFSPSFWNRVEHIDSGAFKEVWRVINENNASMELVLKTTRYKRDFQGSDFNKQRRDAIVMDEATMSPYVLNIYGYCGHSNLVEAASGTLKRWLSRHRKGTQPIQLLQIAVMVARGVEGMHLYHNGMPTFAHADVKVSQFLQIPTTTKIEGDMIFKVNDFNRGRFLTSQNPPEICPFYLGGKHKGSTSRAPEEYMAGAPLTDKIDVFSMGAVFYYILTGKPPFDEQESYTRAIKAITSGKQPHLPKDIETSSDPSIQVIVEAMKRCTQFHPKDRPTSREITTLLTGALEKISRSGK